jgi:hypothetical protein
MKLYFVYKILPVLVHVVNNALTPRIAGFSTGPYVRIKKGYENDKGLIEHELVHSKQFYRLPIIHWLMYLLLPTYRYKCEIEAYREQLRHYPNEDKERLSYKFAMFIVNDYKLNVKFDKTLEALRR